MNLARIVLGLLCAASLVPSLALADEEVRVTVVAILASADKDGKVDPRVEEIAREVRKQDATLKGFRVATTTCKSLEVGRKEKFELIDDQEAVVLVLAASDKEDRVRLKVRPPQVMREITLRICCGKYFPIVTNYQTKEKQERLIMAVMISPCNDK